MPRVCETSLACTLLCTGKGYEANDLLSFRFPLTPERRKPKGLPPLARKGISQGLEGTLQGADHLRFRGLDPR